MKVQDKRRFMEASEKPSMPFFIEFADGRRGEAMTPLHLLDLVVHEKFSDVDDIETLYLLSVKKLKDLAASEFAMDQKRAVVYDALGPMYDNAISRNEEEVKEEKELAFNNHQTPVILDGFDPWTVVASLIKSGYIKVYEKFPVWSDKLKKQGCTECIFKEEKDGFPYCKVWESSGAIEVWNNSCPFVTNGEFYLDYKKVSLEDLTLETYKPGWMPTKDRKKEYIGFRIS